MAPTNAPASSTPGAGADTSATEPKPPSTSTQQRSGERERPPERRPNHFDRPFVTSRQTISG